MTENTEKKSADFAPETGVFLSLHTTFKIGGLASYLFKVANEREVREAYRFAKERNLPVFVLGGGSNVLFPDKGFEGVVIKNEIKGIEAKEEGGRISVRASSGEEWDAFVLSMIERGFFGLENLSGIPGTVGGAPIQNIGAYGVEVGNFIEEVSFFDPKESKLKNFSRKDSEFGYRDSIFKNKMRGVFVISVTFSLSKTFSPNLSYKDIASYFKGKMSPAPMELRNAIIEIRKEKFPDLDIFGTAGSFFKNIIVPKERAAELKEKFPEIVFFEMPGNLAKIPTASILDKVCNLKGHREGNVGLFEKQSLVLVNYGKATEEEISSFKEKVKKIVFDKTGLLIEEEVIIV